MVGCSKNEETFPLNNSQIFERFAQEGNTAEVLGYSLANVYQDYQSIKSSDKEFMVNTINNTTLTDNQKASALFSRTGLSAYLATLSTFKQDVSNSGTFLEQQNNVNSTSEYFNSIIHFEEDLEEIDPCTVQYITCMYTISIGCMGFAPCMVGGSVLCAVNYYNC
ncbi:hypothetical protein A9Q86_12845 [Flavobacteriales bacterium 33_180_T64]|nr:hypothetical protein A9Q86_12845 [Flavobacteriales bacterium 33_180_T64]